jgi:apolipoprotein N-acyltransferase
MDKSPSLAFIYFGVGFTLAAALTMLVLVFIRPLIGEPAYALRLVLMLSPLIVGVLYGLRVAVVGMRLKLRLGQALKRGLGLR